ncbi:hypothetical protein ACIPY5_07310 [Microbacterium sp. NPDC089698]|uniref:hypothetical protein n=1 Tax=Microbacterium sp. NPDC089698 TaxID=3364200 RepID=UPI00381E7DD5
MSRRTIVKGAAWSLPVIAAATALPGAAASGPIISVTCFDSQWTTIRPAMAFPWSTAALSNGDGTFSTVLVAYTSINMSCPVPAGATFVIYSFEPVVSGVVGNASITVQTSDRGTVSGQWKPNGTVPPGTTVQAPVAGVKYADPLLAASNVNAVAAQVIYLDYSWSPTPADAFTGPDASHHITGVTVTYTMTVTPYGPMGAMAPIAYPVTITQTFDRPLLGYDLYQNVNYLYWYAGYPGTAQLLPGA